MQTEIEELQERIEELNSELSDAGDTITDLQEQLGNMEKEELTDAECISQLLESYKAIDNLPNHMKVEEFFATLKP